jgi:prepilin-type N-terminal cleavage/methylation domain-containing protein
MFKRKKHGEKGFSLIELTVAMTIMLILLSVVSTLITRAMSVRQRETRRADALVSVQAALNVISREVANSGFGLYSDALTKVASNGIVTADSGKNQIRLRSNMFNQGDKSACENSVATDTACLTDLPGEDITYFLDTSTQSIVRYDPKESPSTSVVVNKVSALEFKYFNYDPSTGNATPSDTPTASTARVEITVKAQLEEIVGQVNPSDVTYKSQVTLRNASFMLRQY